MPSPPLLLLTTSFQYPLHYGDQLEEPPSCNYRPTIYVFYLLSFLCHFSCKEFASQCAHFHLNTTYTSNRRGQHHCITCWVLPKTQTIVIVSINKSKTEYFPQSRVMLGADLSGVELWTYKTRENVEEIVPKLSTCISNMYECTFYILPRYCHFDNVICPQ